MRTRRNEDTAKRGHGKTRTQQNEDTAKRGHGRMRTRQVSFDNIKMLYYEIRALLREESCSPSDDTCSPSGRIMLSLGIIRALIQDEACSLLGISKNLNICFRP